jgi:hypothetical protein
MEHEMAEQQQTASKYLLDELSEDERVEFEAHMFDCPICADEVKKDFTIAENLKEVVRERKDEVSERSSVWTRWLQPASWIPTFVAAALAVVVCFQLGRPPVYQAQIIPDGSQIVPAARSNPVPLKVDRSNKFLWLSFRVDSSRPDKFICDFQNDAGATVLSVTTQPATSTAFLLNVPVPAKLFPPGRYRMILHPAATPNDSTTFPFALQDDK